MEKVFTLDSFRVALLDRESEPELVFSTADADVALSWARQWLENPLGLAVGIAPPGVEL